MKKVIRNKLNKLSCYGASYTSQTRDKKHFTISEVVADWQFGMN